MDALYQYSKIEDQDTIRLIHLQPSPDLEAEIECSLTQASLRDLEDDITEHYVALSYVWGDSTLRRFVMVDGKRLEITTSLDCALRHIREPSRVLRLWADGICINQNDIEDRNQQVRLMGSIYTLAQHTVIFLGPSSPEKDPAIQYIVTRKNNEHLSLQQRFQESDLKRVVHSHILNHPWFSRVWVLQELVLSQSPWVQIGKHRVKWDLFYRIAVTESGWISDKAPRVVGMEESGRIISQTGQERGVALAQIFQNLRRLPCSKYFAQEEGPASKILET